MKRIGILACLLFLVGTAAFALPPKPADDLAAAWAAIFSPTPGTPAAPGATFATTRGGRIQSKDFCSASANCSPFSPVGCSTTETGATCEAHDRNCGVGQQGYARCGSTYVFCPSCGCTEGAFRYVATGNCCEDGLKEKEEQQCVNGAWVATGFYDCLTRCGPITP